MAISSILVMRAETLLAGYPIFQFYLFFTHLFGTDPRRKKFEEACEAFFTTKVRVSVVIGEVEGLADAFEPVKTALWEKMWEEGFTAIGFIGSKFYRESVVFAPFREIICEGINGVDLFPAFKGFLEDLHNIKHGIVTK